MQYLPPLTSHGHSLFILLPIVTHLKAYTPSHLLALLLFETFKDMYTYTPMFIFLSNQKTEKLKEPVHGQIAKARYVSGIA